MGKVTRKRYGADFKAEVALKAIKGQLTLAEASAKHGIHQTMGGTGFFGVARDTAVKSRT